MSLIVAARESTSSTEGNVSPTPLLAGCVDGNAMESMGTPGSPVGPENTEDAKLLDDAPFFVPVKNVPLFAPANTVPSGHGRPPGKS